MDLVVEPVNLFSRLTALSTSNTVSVLARAGLPKAVDLSSTGECHKDTACTELLHFSTRSSSRPSREMPKSQLTNSRA